MLWRINCASVSPYMILGEVLYLEEDDFSDGVCHLRKSEIFDEIAVLSRGDTYVGKVLEDRGSYLVANSISRWKEGLQEYSNCRGLYNEEDEKDVKRDPQESASGVFFIGADAESR